MVERWFEDFQKQGQMRWQELGLPGKRDENWKYTSLKNLEALKLTRAEAGRTELWQQDSRFLDYRDHSRIVFVNGVFAPSLSDLQALPAGVRIRSLAELFQAPDQDSHLVEEMLRRYPSETETAFAAYSRSAFIDGCLLAVEADVQMSEPLHLIYLSDLESSTGVAAGSFPRTLISLGPRAEMSVVESYLSLGASSGFTNAVTDIYLAESASLRHLKLQDESSATHHFGFHRIRQANRSRLQAFNLSLGAQLSRHELLVRVEGEGCETELNGLYLARGKQHVDHTTRLEHLAPNSSSRQHYKGILNDQARAVFRGRIVIDAVAQKTQSSQLNNNLLLTSQCEIDTLPQLEIFADDVKATHGATVGQLNEEEVFYIRSRAIAKDVARKMVLSAFAGEIVESLSQPAMVSLVQNLITDRITQMAVNL